MASGLGIFLFAVVIVALIVIVILVIRDRIRNPYQNDQLIPASKVLPPAGTQNVTQANPCTGTPDQNNC